MCPIPAAVAPPPITSRSTISTRNPRSAKASAQAAPTIPAPTITTSNVSLLMFPSDADPLAQRIVRIQNQLGLRIHKSGTCNTGIDLAILHMHTSLKNAADDAFLFPDLSFLDLAISIQTRQLRAGPGTTRRAIVSLPRTQHEILAVHSGNLRLRKQLHVIDLLSTIAGDCRSS